MKLLLLSFMVWACTQPQSPTSVEPAAKALIDPFSSPVEWSCGTDSVWSVFNGHFTFHIDGDQVAIRERLAQRSLTHRTHDATMTYDESRCMLHSGFVSADSVTRIWKGYVWRDSYYRYYLQDEAGTYRINRRFTQADGSYDPPFGVVWYRDFSDLNNRFKPRPDGLYEIRKYNVHSYYLPVNFSRAALDTLYRVPKDDRPYLVDPIVGVDYAPDEPAALAPRVSSGPTGSSSTSSSSTGTGTPTTTVSGGDDGGNEGKTNTPPNSQSSDATLSSLSISGVSISFMSDKFQYSVTVENSVSSISVSATPEQASSTVRISINSSLTSSASLKVGINAVGIRVTAEDGSVQIYVVLITRKEAPPVESDPTPGTGGSGCTNQTDRPNRTCYLVSKDCCLRNGGGAAKSVDIREVYREGKPCKRYESWSSTPMECTGSSAPSSNAPESFKRKLNMTEAEFCKSVSDTDSDGNCQADRVCYEPMTGAYCPNQ